MAFFRIVLGWGAVTLLFALWSEAARRIKQVPGPALPAFKSDLTANATEALLLTLFAGLWFGSLGGGGAWLLFLVVGGLMEVPARLRSHPVGGVPWKAVGVAILKVMAGGVVLSFVMG